MACSWVRVYQFRSSKDFVSVFLSKVPSKAPLLDVQRYLEELADAFCWKAYPRCSRLFNSLLQLTSRPDDADTVLKFLMQLCASIVWHDFYGDGLFELLVSFCQQLSSFSSLESWKACVLTLMAIASYFPGSAHRWHLLETLNSQLQLDRIVLYKETMLKDVPAECVSLVCFGLAAKVCQNLEQGHSSLRLIDALKVSDDLMNIFHREGSIDHLEKCLQLTNMAVEKCEVNELENDDYTLVSRLMGGLVDVIELKDRVPNNVYLLAGHLVAKIPTTLPFYCSMKLLNCVIESKLHSSQLAYLLRIARICVTDRWPKSNCNLAQDVLQELLDHVFGLTLSDVRAAVSVERQVVEVVVNLYLAIIWMEAKDHIDENIMQLGLSGCLARQSAKERWLLPLSNELDELTLGEADHRLAISLRTAKRLVSYALKANADPAHVVTNGLPLL